MPDLSFGALSLEDQTRAMQHLEQVLFLDPIERRAAANEFENSIFTLAASAVYLHDTGMPYAHVIHLVMCALHVSRAKPA